MRYLVGHPPPRCLCYRVRNRPHEAVEREVGHELLPVGGKVARGRSQEAEDDS